MAQNIAKQTDHRIGILVVDDDPGIRANFEDRLKKAGYRVEVAANGMHALTKIKAGFLPQLIITDIVMPGMNGPELIKTIRNHFDLAISQIPITVMTAANDKALVLETARLGISNIFFKPLDYNDIIKKIHLFFMKQEIKAAA